MGNGYASNNADIVEPDFIKKMCSKEWDAWEEISKEADLAIPELVEMVEQVYLNHAAPKNEDEAAKGIRKAYLALFRAFKKKTGLSLQLEYHDSENNGDRYDGVDGYYWSVSGVWQQTPAGKKYRRFIKSVGFVSYG